MSKNSLKKHKSNRNSKEPSNGISNATSTKKLVSQFVLSQHTGKDFILDSDDEQLPASKHTNSGENSTNSERIYNASQKITSLLTEQIHESQESKLSTKKRSRERLPLRGPVDSSFERGDYAAQRVDSSTIITSSIDDLFDKLEAGDEFENDLESKDQIPKTEKDYAKWLEVDAFNSKISRSEDTDGDNKDKPVYKETSNIPEMPMQRGIGLSKQEHDLWNQVFVLKEAQRQEIKTVKEASFQPTNITKEVRNLMQSTIQLIRLRIRLQQALRYSISIPSSVAWPFFLNSSSETLELSELRQNRQNLIKGYSRILTRLLDVCSLTQKDKLKSPKKSLKIAQFESQIGNHFKSTIKTARDVLKIWGDTFLRQNSGLHSYNEEAGDKNKSIFQTEKKLTPLDQVSAVLQNPSRLVRKSQRNRSHLRIFGNPIHYYANHSLSSTEGTSLPSLAIKHQTALALRAVAIADGDHELSIYDDVDFAREMMKHMTPKGNWLMEEDTQFTKQGTDELESLLDFKKSDSAFPNRVLSLDSRKPSQHAKGKSVQFLPRPQLVGFMIPVPFDNNREETTKLLFESLFQNI